MTSVATRITEYEPLAQHTSWRIGGPARFYLETSTREELQEALAWSREREIPTLLLGGGTNVLISDRGFEGLVLRYRAQEWRVEETDEGGLLYAQAGTPIGRLAWKLGAQGWGGLEWAAGLPGTLGGAIYGNAGCYGGDVAGILRRAWLLVTNEVQEWPRERFAYGYRSSCLKRASKLPPPGSAREDATPERAPTGTPPPLPIILAAEFGLARGEQAELMLRTKQVATSRKEKTPVGHSCGSVFQNPAAGTLPAGQLIDQAGLKGTTIGAAEISQRHANYIINRGGASSDDVLRLIELARNEVQRQFKIELELEVQLVGGFGR